MSNKLKYNMKENFLHQIIYHCSEFWYFSNGFNHYPNFKYNHGYKLNIVKLSRKLFTNTNKRKITKYNI